MRYISLTLVVFAFAPGDAKGSLIEESEPGMAYVALSIGNAGLRAPSTFGPEWRLELRFDRRLWILQPFVGTMSGSRGRWYTFAGVLTELHLTRSLLLIPSFAPGLYRAGDGPDLGFPLEFRSQLELAFQLDRGMRVGFSLSHISNARLGHRNPGVEVLALTYALPLNLAGLRDN